MYKSGKNLIYIWVGVEFDLGTLIIAHGILFVLFFSFFLARVCCSDRFR